MIVLPTDNILGACDSGRHIICVLLIIVFLVLSLLPVTY